ncbi:hypothetical protein A3D14_01155 [Candidatus Saccharibacteria bacterium RIFCSPHIGHO2_02_FULL_47_12]|nr:MAG: hypothetical protein A3D14_01155 [Candidatus Saccharibacteria bacterium RIFCSPHIGHO2_02_FULL_47_12]
MGTSEDVLVVILSTFLAIFLLLGIVALIKVIQLLNRLKHVAETAEQIADKAEAAGEFFQKAASRVAITRLIGNIVKTVKSRDDKEGK